MGWVYTRRVIAEVHYGRSVVRTILLDRAVVVFVGDSVGGGSLTFVSCHQAVVIPVPIVLRLPARSAECAGCLVPACPFDSTPGGQPSRGVLLACRLELLLVVGHTQTLGGNLGFFTGNFFAFSHAPSLALSSRSFNPFTKITGDSDYVYGYGRYLLHAIAYIYLVL